jgi:hypothetical protein
MSRYALSLCFLAGTCAAVKLNTPVSALKPETPVKDSLELWNQTAFMLLGPYWAQHSTAKRTDMLRQLLSSGSVHDDLAHRITRIQSEKIRRAQRMEETGVEVIPGCGKGEPCTTKSYYESVLLQSGDHEDTDSDPTAADDCCDVLWADCLQSELSSCMQKHWNADTDAKEVDKLLILKWNEGPATGFSSFRQIPTSKHAHAHSLLQKSGSGDHNQCPVKACTWCAEHGFTKNHQAALIAWTYSIAPPQLDNQICFGTR